MGWAPKESWKGDPEHWIDAQTFVEKGRTVMPLLQANNRKLQGDLSREQQARQALEAQVKTMQTNLQLLEEHRETDVKAQVEERIAQLRAGIAEASQDGDHTKVAELTDQLVTERTNLAGVEAEKKSKQTATTEAPAVRPDITQWYISNPEFLSDPQLKTLGSAVAMQLREEGDTSLGAVFLDKVKSRTHEMLGRTTNRSSKTSSGNGGSGRSDTGGTGNNGKSYSDLPREAKDACERMAARFVGQGKSYKTKAEWQSAYSAKYFEQE